MEGHIGTFNWFTLGKNLIIYVGEPSYDWKNLLDTMSGRVSVRYSAKHYLQINYILVKSYASVYDKELSEVLTPDGVHVVNAIREDIVNQEIKSMQLESPPEAYSVYVPAGVGPLAIENALRRAGIAARVR